MRTTDRIEPFDITEGNLRATKDTSTFGGPNMWRLHIKSRDGYWEDMTWSSVHTIQKFFATKLPYYRELEEKVAKRYEKTN